VLNHLDPASALALGLLVFSLTMVIMFEATNGFHDAANAVATVIYTKSLQPGQAVVLSGIMNFVGVMVGGIAVALLDWFVDRRRSRQCFRALAQRGRRSALGAALEGPRGAGAIADTGIRARGGLVFLDSKNPAR
jgi:hypothetical protein